jgi:hypothetical protein
MPMPHWRKPGRCVGRTTDAGSVFAAEAHSPKAERAINASPSGNVPARSIPQGLRSDTPR